MCDESDPLEEECKRLKEVVPPDDIYLFCVTLLYAHDNLLQKLADDHLKTFLEMINSQPDIGHMAETMANALEFIQCGDNQTIRFTRSQETHIEPEYPDGHLD